MFEWFLPKGKHLLLPAWHWTHLYVREKLKLCQRNRRHWKNVPTLAAENAQKLAAKSSKVQNNSAESRRQRTRTELKKPNPPTLWVRVE